MCIFKNEQESSNISISELMVEQGTTILMIQKVILIVIRLRIYMYNCAIGTCFFSWTTISWSFGLLGNEDFLILRFCLLFFPLVFFFSKKKEKEMLLREGGV